MDSSYDAVRFIGIESTRASNPARGFGDIDWKTQEVSTSGCVLMDGRFPLIEPVELAKKIDSLKYVVNKITQQLYVGLRISGLSCCVYGWFHDEPSRGRRWYNCYSRSINSIVDVIKISLPLLLRVYSRIHFVPIQCIRINSHHNAMVYYMECLLREIN